MSEVLASLRKKGGKEGVNIFGIVAANAPSNTSWASLTLSDTVNDASGSSVGVMLDKNFAHLNNGSIVIDKAIPKAYLTGRCFSWRDTSGTRAYSGIRIVKNQTVIATETGSSSQANPYFRRIETSLAAGDVLTIQIRTTAVPPASVVNGWIYATTD